jgi:type III restriction enzyme
MAAVNFELRSYQREALRTLRVYLQKVIRMDGVANNPARAAFNDVVEATYSPAPMVDEQTPYVCIRIPTGGGKTVVAAHAVGVAAKEYLQTSNPMVLWLVPSTAILDQTLAALRDLNHPYRAALAAEFGRNLSVLTVTEALALSRPDATGGACIIVGTLHAFRRDDMTGLKVYQDAGALMDHFSGLAPQQLERLEKVEGTDRPIASLCNVLQLHRPMIIVDEAHNARTPLSFETLKRFDPSLIIEMTATPQLTRDIENDIFPSNVLFHVSAAELKAEEMIKLPIRLSTDTDWRKVIAQALDCQKALEDAAKAELVSTGEYIRPIVLFQAQSKSKTDPHRLTPEAVVQFLTDDKRIPRDQIAIQATDHAELDTIDDIAAPDCLVRYVVTVQKLREGWDCPFAYVLCSVAELSSPTAVEQILGRVLRMPKARRKTRDVLNRAYAFVASNNFQTVAERLKDGLVDGAGFNRLEAELMVKAHGAFEFDEERADFVHNSDALPDAPNATAEHVIAAIDKLPPALKARVQFNTETRKIGVTRSLSRDERNLMQIAFAKVDGAERVIDRLFIRSNRIQASEIPEGEKPPFLVPRLGILRQGVLELFGPDHFLDLPWNLAACDPAPFAQRFAIQAETKAGEIDVSNKGHMKIAFIGQLHDQLAMAIQEPAWTLARLVNWIDRGIPHPDVTKPAARVFIQRALEAALQSKGYTLDQLARYKYELRRTLAEEIQSLRVSREEGRFKALFATDAQSFETSAELALLFDEQSYVYNQPYKGARKFNKHYFPIIGDLKPDGEEFRCAVFLDECAVVRYWVRNVDRKPNAFWLQLSGARFYPDFVALLVDGRILVVEYKGSHLEEDAKEKRMIGELWAEASGGKCLFAMPTGGRFDTISAILAPTPPAHY